MRKFSQNWILHSQTRDVTTLTIWKARQWILIWSVHAKSRINFRHQRGLTSEEAARTEFLGEFLRAKRMDKIVSSTVGSSHNSTDSPTHTTKKSSIGLCRSASMHRLLKTGWCTQCTISNVKNLFAFTATTVVVNWRTTIDRSLKQALCPWIDPSLLYRRRPL